MITERKLFNILSIIEGASFTISIIFGILIVIKFTSSIYPETNKNIYPLGFNLFNQTSTSTPIILGTWPGIKSGSCLHNSELSTSSCSFSDLNCENVDAVDPIELSNWDSTILRFYSEFDSSLQYEDLYRDAVPNGTACPSDKKPFGLLDTMNNTLCLNKSKECPINYMKVVESFKKPKLPEYNYHVFKIYILYK